MFYKNSLNLYAFNERLVILFQVISEYTRDAIFSIPILIIFLMVLIYETYIPTCVCPNTPEPIDSCTLYQTLLQPLSSGLVLKTSDMQQRGGGEYRLILRVVKTPKMHKNKKKEISKNQMFRILQTSTSSIK